MPTQIEKIDDITIVSLSGEVTVNNCNDIREVYSKVVKEGCKKMIVDFEKVIFIDSSGLAILIELVQKLKKGNGTLHLCCVNEKIIGLFEITKIHRIMNIYDTRDAALKAFQ